MALVRTTVVPAPRARESNIAIDNPENPNFLRIKSMDHDHLKRATADPYASGT